MSKREVLRSRLIAASGEAYTMTQERTPAATYGRQFMVVFPDALDPLLSDPKCGGATLKVLLWTWKNLSFERWAHLSQYEVAGQLALSQAAVSRALKDLFEQGFLERQGSGPRQEWRLTPEAGWRGTAANYQKTKRLREQGEGKPRLRVVGKPQDANRAGAALVSADIDHLG